MPSTVIFIFKIFFSMFWAGATGFISSGVTIFPGTHFRSLSPLTVYEASVPLTYILPHNVYFNPGSSIASLPKCPFTDRHLVRIAAAAEELDISVDDLLRRAALPYNITINLRPRRAIETIGNVLNWCCGTATDTELHTVTANEEAVDKHLDALQDVLKGDHLDLVRSINTMNGFSHNVSRLLDKVHSAVVGMNDELVRNEGVSIKDLYTTVMAYVVRLQSQVYYGQFLGSNEEIHLQCRNNLLPATIVPEDVLRGDLQELAKNISRDGYEVSLPIGEVGPFYALPITSCHFSPRRIVVTVKIPVKKMNEGWMLFEYIPSPMAWRGYTCTLVQEDMFVAVSKNSVRTITGLQRESCSPRSSGKCLLPRQEKLSSETE